MALALVAGIYYLFRYLKSRNVSALVLSFLLFFAAFMFTQKAALILIGMGAVILWLLYTGRAVWKDCLVAAALPVLLYAAFLAFLYYEDVLAMYFKANFELNSHIPDVFYTRRFIHPSFEMTVPLLLAFYALARCVWSGNLYVKSSVRFSRLNTSFVFITSRPLFIILPFFMP